MEFGTLEALVFYFIVYVCAVLVAFMLFMCFCGIVNFFWMFIHMDKEAIPIIDDAQPVQQEEICPAIGPAELPDLPEPAEFRAPTLERSKPTEAPEPPRWRDVPQQYTFAPSSPDSLKRRFEALRHCGFPVNEMPL